MRRLLLVFAIPFILLLAFPREMRAAANQSAPVEMGCTEGEYIHHQLHPAMREALRLKNVALSLKGKTSQKQILVYIAIYVPQCGRWMMAVFQGTAERLRFKTNFFKEGIGPKGQMLDFMTKRMSQEVYGKITIGFKSWAYRFMSGTGFLLVPTHVWKIPCKTQELWDTWGHLGLCYGNPPGRWE